MAQPEQASLNMTKHLQQDAPKALPLYEYGLLNAPEVINPPDSDSDATQSDNEMAVAKNGGIGAATNSDTESDEDTDLDDDGLLIQQAVARSKSSTAASKRSAPDKSSGTAARKRPRATRPGGYVTLKKLIDAGLLMPGVDNLWCEYKGVRSVGSLTEEGRISWEGMTFESPSAWSIHLKRLVTPGRKADDGWKTIRYDGKLLEHYKVQLGASEVESATEDAPGGTSLASAQTKMKLIPSKLTSKTEPLVRKPKQTPAGTGKENGDPTHASRHGSAVLATEYSAKRPKREVKQPSRLIDVTAGSHEGHMMVPCQPFSGPAGAGTPGSQPFSIEISSMAQVMMDLHAHLSSAEIIGLLGGQYDPESRHMKVQGAFPVNELATEDDSVNVEMDPEDQVRVCDRIRSLGMVCIGWYHSHPDFPAIPSIVDIENQARYQALHRMPSGEEPYIAAIVAPYMKPEAVSHIAWFYVSYGGSSWPEYGKQPLAQGCVPRELSVSRATREEETCDTGLLSGIKHTIKKYAQKFRSRVEMYNNWQGNTSCLDKLRVSLTARVPLNWSNGEKTSYVNNIVEIVRDMWYPREEASDDSITQSDSQNVGHGNGGAGNNDHDVASDDTEATS